MPSQPTHVAVVTTAVNHAMCPTCAGVSGRNFDKRMAMFWAFFGSVIVTVGSWRLDVMLPGALLFEGCAMTAKSFSSAA